MKISRLQKMHHDVLIVAITQYLQGGGKQKPSPKGMNVPTLPNTLAPNQPKKHLNKIK